MDQKDKNAKGTAKDAKFKSVGDQSDKGKLTGRDDYPSDTSPDDF